MLRLDINVQRHYNPNLKFSRLWNGDGGHYALSKICITLQIVDEAGMIKRLLMHGSSMMTLPSEYCALQRGGS